MARKQPTQETDSSAFRHIGRRILEFDETDSTNTQAAAHAGDPSQDGLVVLAKSQTAGRGQHGRSWVCTPNAGVLLSVLLFPPAPLRRPALLTAWAAVSVCRAIKSTAGVRPVIKWPNDVLIGGRKVCGILIEQGRGTVVGIGLNVKQPKEDLTSAGLTEAISLEIASGRTLDCRRVAEAVIAQLDAEYVRLLEGDWATLEAGWRRGLGLIGRVVVVESHDGTHRGLLRGLSWEGLDLDRDDGDSVRFKPEMVQHVAPMRRRPMAQWQPKRRKPTVAELKTKKTDASVDAFLRGIADEKQRQDAMRVAEMMQAITGEPPKMWGPAIVGFGTYHYRYASGREGDWFLTGFSPRKGNLTLYIIAGFARYEPLLARLGKFKTGKSCLYVKQLDDVDEAVLKELIEASVGHLRDGTK